MKRLWMLCMFLLLLGTACSKPRPSDIVVSPEQSPAYNSLIREGSRFDVYNGSVFRMNLYLQQLDGVEVHYQRNADGTALYEECTEVIGSTGEITYRQLLMIIDAVAKYAHEQDFGLIETSIFERKLPMYATFFVSAEKVKAVQNLGDTQYFLCSISKKTVVPKHGTYDGVAVGVLEAVNSATPDPIYIVLER